MKQRVNWDPRNSAMVLRTQNPACCGSCAESENLAKFTQNFSQFYTFLPLALCAFCTIQQFLPNLLQVARDNQYRILFRMGTVT